ncbi:MAG: GH3 auxin-responsive promoter family protein [Gammaproteobacteria bacterium]
MNAIVKLATACKMALIRYAYWNAFIASTRHPGDTQTALLMNIIRRQRETTFGREHGFQNINSVEDYRSAVPPSRYEAFRGYVERQEQQKLPHLNWQQPKIYAQTSGTTGKPKYIPILRHTIAQYRRSQHIVAYSKYSRIKGVFDGKVLAIVSPAEEGVLETGTPYGSMSGMVYKSMPALLRSKYVVPAEVFDLDDYESKYYLIAKYALAEPNITMIATANPSTLLKLESVINSRLGELINEVQTINPKRAAELRSLVSHGVRLRFADTWPRLKSVTTWTNGSCGVLIPKIEAQLPEGARIVEMGYLSSEFRGSITVDVNDNLQIPTLHENYFEFVERDCWENRDEKFLSLEQIEQGKQYYVFATTGNGLYRYDIDDIIEVTGRYNATPTIRFVQKGKGVTNLTGEKLYESQLIQAIATTEAENNITIPFFILLACPSNLEYTLLIEHIPFEAKGIERQLAMLNTEFDAKRRSERLKPLRIVFVEQGTGEAYKLDAIQRGQREGQYKLVHLMYKQDCPFEFSKYYRGQNHS